MIDLLGEAKNHIELYECARNYARTPDLLTRAGDNIDLKSYWKEHYRLPFPQPDKNPSELKRALLLVAGWYLFHAEPRLSVEDTQKKLSEWYLEVMTFASKGMGKKAGTQLMEKVRDFDTTYWGSDNKTENLDRYLEKNNYYRLVCQAVANGPLRSQKIVVPYRIIDVWKEKKYTVNDRVLDILCHYYEDSSIPFDFNQTAVSLWTKGDTNWKNSKGRITLTTNGFGKGKKCQIIINDDDNDDDRWSKDEEMLELRDWPPMNRQLSDQALDDRLRESNPKYWLNTRILKQKKEMQQKYKVRVELSKQCTNTGPKRIRLRCFLLLFLYAMSEGNAPDGERWKEDTADGERWDWDKVLRSLSDGQSAGFQREDRAQRQIYTSSKAVTWENVEQWTIEHFNPVIELLDCCDSFFSAQEEDHYFGKVNQTGNAVYPIFIAKE